MNEFEHKLNLLLVDTFKNILKVEEQVIQQNNDMKLSISEIHLLGAIGDETNSGKTISDISGILGISLPSVTVAVNKLIKKELLKKEKSTSDGRSVYIYLTPAGEDVIQCHADFHRNMVENASKGMDLAEQAVLLKGVKKLNDFFKRTSLQLNQEVKQEDNEKEK